MFAHYYDPHEPYAPPAPYDTLFYPEYDGQIGNSFVLHDHFPGVQGMNFEDLQTLKAKDWDQIKALYDGEIAFTDRAIDHLLEGLTDRGLLERTIVVFLSDHGEEFFEHLGFGHGHTLFGEVIRVPLVFSFPSRLPAGRRITRQVRLVDVMPTVLDLLGVETDTALEGVSLLPLLTGQGDVHLRQSALLPPRVAYSEGLLRGSERKSVTAHPWKLIYDFQDRSRMVFNVDDDPREQRNLAGESPEALGHLESLMFKSLFETYDTWHLEVAGTGSGSTFDIDIVTGNDMSIGKIPLYKLLAPSGGTADPGPEPRLDSAGSVLEVKGFKVKNPASLAFTVQAPPGLPIRFDIRIDGEHVPEKVFIGESLSNPKQFPLALRRRRCTVHQAGGPRKRPDPPYALIWHSEPRYKGNTVIKLNEQTRRELRALGYIQ
jgi:hypothetical protein